MSPTFTPGTILCVVQRRRADLRRAHHVEHHRQARSHESLSRLFPLIRQEDQSRGVPQAFQNVRQVDVRPENLGREHPAVARRAHATGPRPPVDNEQDDWRARAAARRATQPSCRARLLSLVSRPRSPVVGQWLSTCQETMDADAPRLGLGLGLGLGLLGT